MILKETKLDGAYILELERIVDERGFFARTYCENEFKKVGITFEPVQANISFNRHKNTMRGMHFQVHPYEEAKLVSCIEGSIYDVIIDVRSDSPTFNEWIAVELNSENRRMLYIPRGFAHGFMTLKNNTTVSYLMSEFYKPGADRGICWNDPAINMKWPAVPKVISEKDKSWAPYHPQNLTVGT